MIDNFKVFADAVRARFKEMSESPLFVVDSERDAVWEKYLGAFPPGSNPVFRKRTEFDCSCCRHFIRDIGNVVAIQNGVITSMWHLNGLPSPYQEVADVLAGYLDTLVVRDLFLTPFDKHGQMVSHEASDGGVITWNHFSVTVPNRLVTSDHVSRKGNARTTHEMLLRAVTELKSEAIAIVVDLIEQKALYRGDEFKAAVLEFQQLQARLMAVPDFEAQYMLAWTLLDKPAARFRNSVIGTLVQDLSEGIDLEGAVRSYEVKVAPQNYKRPTSLITKGMVESAVKTLQELGLEQALERRHARLSDVSVNSVLFVDNAVKGKLKGGIAGLLMEEVKPVDFDGKHAETIGIDDFVANVLPKTKSMQVFLDGGLLNHFVSLTAPVHEDSKSLFKWGNDFGWSYDGNVTDSIKAKVKRAGGQVDDVAMRVSLAWNNTDDLDLHVREPGGNEICFSNKCNKLDVDMNASNLVRDPVENVRWVNPPKNGVYVVMVHNFTRRESIDVGFIVEVDCGQGPQTFSHPKALGSKTMAVVVHITVKNGQVQMLVPGAGITAGALRQDKWGLKTLDTVRVNSLVLSPNHWQEPGVGNKHWLFILDGCKCDLPTRGIYNEFLSSGLEKHRKVFEVLGDKTKCPVVDDQMSGVGFSSGRGDKVTVIAMGPSLNKAYAIAF